MISLFFILHSFHSFRPWFWDSENFFGFLKIDVYFVNFWGGVCLNDVICLCITFHLHFNYVSCIIDVCFYVGTLCVGRFGFG